MIILASLLLAAVPGTPESTLPELDTPTVRVSVINDNFAGGSRDDGRTAAFAAAAFWRELAFSADYSLLTDRPTARRVDELTAALTYQLGPVRVGPGVRYAGDLAGDDVQNGWHRINGDDHVSASYDRHQWEPLLVATVLGRMQPGEVLALDAVATCALGTRTQRADAAVTMSLGDREAAVFTGPQVWFDRGDATAASRAATSRRGTQGWRVGLRLPCLSVQVLWTQAGDMATEIQVSF